MALPGLHVESQMYCRSICMRLIHWYLAVLCHHVVGLWQVLVCAYHFPLCTNDVKEHSTICRFCSTAMLFVCVREKPVVKGGILMCPLLLHTYCATWNLETFEHTHTCIRIPCFLLTWRWYSGCTMSAATHARHWGGSAAWRCRIYLVATVVWICLIPLNVLPIFALRLLWHVNQGTPPLDFYYSLWYFKLLAS